MASTNKTAAARTSSKKRRIVMKNTDCPTVYSNFMGVGATPFDLAIIFGEVDLSEESGTGANPKVKVILAPEQAANLIKMVGDVLKQYVAANGSLRAGGVIEGLGVQDRTKLN